MVSVADILTAVVLAIAQAAPAPASAPPDPAPPASAATVVVVAPRTPPPDRYASLRAATVEAPSGELARWRTPICPQSQGASPEMNRYFENRVREIAAKVGAPLDKRKCSGNLQIVFVNNSKAVPQLFRSWTSHQWGAHQTDLANGAINILTSEEQIPADGSSPQNVCFGRNCYIQVSAQASRLIYPVVAGIQHCFAIVNTNTLQGIRVGALSAALSLSCLAEIRAGRVWSGSIVDDLVPSGAQEDIRPQDLSYLRSLYLLTGDTHASAQVAQIAHNMAADERK